MIATLPAPTPAILELIGDAAWNQDRAGLFGVQFRDIHQHNATNHTFSGTILYNDFDYGFVIEMGDQNGTKVIEWGEAEDVGVFDPGPPLEPRTFIPTEGNRGAVNPAAWRVYAAWRKQPWFQEQEAKYAYDRHFQPGGYVENHYRDWAAAKGMKPGFLSDLTPAERASLKS